MVSSVLKITSFKMTSSSVCYSFHVKCSNDAQRKHGCWQDPRAWNSVVVGGGVKFYTNWISESWSKSSKWSCLWVYANIIYSLPVCFVALKVRRCPQLCSLLLALKRESSSGCEVEHRGITKMLLCLHTVSHMKENVFTSADPTLW